MFSIVSLRRNAAASLCFVLAFSTFTFSQTLKILHTFKQTDGEIPYSGLVHGSDGYLYGTTFAGGTAGCGTVFKISEAGKFTSIYSFAGGNDGCNPQDSVIRDASGNLYGTTGVRRCFERGNRFQNRQIRPGIRTLRISGRKRRGISHQ